MTKLEKAIIFATNAHSEMLRKGTSIPYIYHPLEALLIASSLTENEDVLCATVLHDTIEDTETTQEQLEKEFGPNVADMVLACSEDKGEEDWHTRKQKAIDSHKNAPKDVQIVLLSDKLANLRSIYKDYHIIGDELWNRFNETNPQEQFWYYCSFGYNCGDLLHTPAYDEYLKLLGNIMYEVGMKEIEVERMNQY